MCFSMQWLEQLLIYLVVLGAIFAILRIIIPMVLSSLPPVVTQIINIILWAIICIIIIYIAFDLINCLGGHSLMPPRAR